MKPSKPEAKANHKATFSPLHPLTWRGWGKEKNQIQVVFVLLITYLLIEIHDVIDREDRNGDGTNKT